jgi:hypothetical protein
VVDFDPLLCAAADKARIEAANGVAQLDYITHLVTALGITEIRESHVREFPRIAVSGIYPCGGRYRDASVSILISGSSHRPPDASEVGHHVVDLVGELNASRGREPATRRAAHALWRLNWIHPFRGGNGYLAALRATDASVDGGGPNLTVMEFFVTEVVTRQLASVIDRRSGGPVSRSTPRRDADSS